MVAVCEHGRFALVRIVIREALHRVFWLNDVREVLRNDLEMVLLRGTGTFGSMLAATGAWFCSTSAKALTIVFSTHHVCHHRFHADSRPWHGPSGDIRSGHAVRATCAYLGNADIARRVGPSYSHVQVVDLFSLCEYWEVPVEYAANLPE